LNESLTRALSEPVTVLKLKIGPDTAIVVSSMRVVKELMDQQSNITCDRPKSYMADTMYEQLHMALIRYHQENRPRIIL
jgi:hypothetical protein